MFIKNIYILNLTYIFMNIILPFPIMIPHFEDGTVNVVSILSCIGPPWRLSHPPYSFGFRLLLNPLPLGPLLVPILLLPSSLLYINI